MTQQVPNPTIARGVHIGAPLNTVYSGSPQTTGSLVAVAPPPVMPTPGTARRQRVFGLVPAQAGGLHPLVAREKPRVAVDAKQISQTRALLRRADAEQRAAETAWIATAPNGGPGDPEKLKLARESIDKAAMLRRTLAEMEAAASSRPIAVTLATVREPSEVAEEIAKGETSYVCLHDGCKGQRWADESALRRAHPTHADMQRAQQCHVFAILCEAPLDPLDPDGEKVGYVAPVGRDGTTIAARAAEAVDDKAGLEEEVSTLRTELAEMRAMLAEALTAKKPK
jgi:hypothetical protein